MLTGSKNWMNTPGMLWPDQTLKSIQNLYKETLYKESLYNERSVQTKKTYIQKQILKKSIDTTAGQRQCALIISPSQYIIYVQYRLIFRLVWDANSLSNFCSNNAQTGVSLHYLSLYNVSLYDVQNIRLVKNYLLIV